MEQLGRRPAAADLFWTGVGLIAMLGAAGLITAGLLRFPSPVVIGALALALLGPLILWQPFLGLLAFLALMYVHPEQWFPQLEALRLPLMVANVTLVGWALQVLRRGETFRWTANLGWMALFAGTMLLSPVLLGDGYLMLTLMDAARLGLLFLLIQQLLNSKERLRGAMHWLLGVTVVVAALAIYGWLTRTGVLEDRGRMRALVLAGNFDDPNDLAAYLVVAVPVALLLAAQGGERLKRFWGAAALAVLLTAIFLCDSRGGLLALGVGGAAFLLRRTGPAGQAGLGLCVVIGVLALGSLDFLSMGLRQDDSAMGRVNAWTAGLRMFGEHPLAGVGYEAFQEHYPIPAHNSFVQVLAEGGFLGALAWVGVNYWALLTLFRISRSETGPLPDYASAMHAALLASLTAGMFLSHTYRPIPLIPVALAAAWSTQVPRRGWADWPHYLAIPLITLAGAGIIYLVTKGLL